MIEQHGMGARPARPTVVLFPDPTSCEEKGLANLSRIPGSGPCWVRTSPLLCYITLNQIPDLIGQQGVWAIQICIVSNGPVAFLWLANHKTVLKLQSDWRVEIPQCRPKFTRPFSLLRVGSGHKTRPVGELRHTRCHGNAINVCGTHGSEHAYIATKWRSVMNLATKCSENVSVRYRRSYDKTDVALHCLL